MFLLGYCISFDMKTCAQSSAADFIRVLRHIIAPLFSQYTCQKKLKHFFLYFSSPNRSTWGSEEFKRSYCETHLKYILL